MNNRFRTVAFGSNGNTPATGYSSGVIRLWKSVDGSPVAELKRPTGPVSKLLFGPAGVELAGIFDADNTIRLWDVPTGRETAVMKGHKSKVTSISFHPNAERIASASEDGTVRLWDSFVGAEVLVLREPKVSIVKFTDDGKKLIGLLNGGLLKLWNSEPVSKFVEMSPSLKLSR